MGPKWRYLLNELGVGLRRNLLITLATFLTTTVSLAVLGVGLMVQKQVNLASDLFYTQVEVSIFLLDNISESQRLSLENDLTANPIVDHVLYESKQDAYEHFQEIFANQPDLLDSVTPEILPASFRVKLTDPEQFAVIESQFSDYPGVQTVSDQRDLLDRFFLLLGYLRRGAWWIGILQLIAAAALIATTIRITAYARREQIGIMKLVGATNWYIRLPFLLEGLIAGVGGALLAGGALIVLSQSVLSGVGNVIGFMPIVGSREALEVFPWLVAVGAATASLASFFSLRRFLDV
jgi:cell division transport system permease protein